MKFMNYRGKSKLSCKLFSIFCSFASNAKKVCMFNVKSQYFVSTMSNICLGRHKCFIMFKIWNLDLFLQLSIVSSYLNTNLRMILDGIIRNIINMPEHMVLAIFFSSSLYSNPCSICPFLMIIKWLLSHRLS